MLENFNKRDKKYQLLGIAQGNFFWEYCKSNQAQTNRFYKFLAKPYL